MTGAWAGTPFEAEYHRLHDQIEEARRREAITQKAKEAVQARASALEGALRQIADNTREDAARIVALAALASPAAPVCEHDGTMEWREEYGCHRLAFVCQRCGAVGRERIEWTPPATPRRKGRVLLCSNGHPEYQSVDSATCLLCGAAAPEKAP